MIIKDNNNVIGDSKVISLSDNERIKKESNFLRGTIVKDLDNNLTGGFSADNAQLIRFHGMYQQDDRDVRLERMCQKLEPLISMMLRCRLPGGVITPKQWLAIDDFSEKHTLYGSIRLTSRQTFQLHGLLKPWLKDAHLILNKLGLDSIATAGDVNRNVICTSNPMESVIHHQVWELSKNISEHLLPKSHAYAEIWLDDRKTEFIDFEPILGAVYLPRKFKISIAIPPINDVDVHANDLSFIAITNDIGQLIGFNVLVGGGLAMTYGDVTTYPRKASEFGYVDINNIIKITEAVVTTQRDWGDRYDRKHAKTKYTLDRVGVNIFKEEVESRAGVRFSATREYVFTERGDRFGWVYGIDGYWHLTIFVENGRICNSKNKLMKHGLAEIARVHSGCFRLTANQNLIISGVSQDNKCIIDDLSKEYSLINNDHVSLQRKVSMACVALPTCPLAMAEAERFLPQFISKIDSIMLKYGLDNDCIILRVTGCPNNCARAMLSEIGLTGRALGRYNLYLGGNKIGTRIPRLYKENITEDEILKILDTTIGSWAKGRNHQESYGDYVVRVGIVRAVINSKEDFHNV